MSHSLNASFSDLSYDSAQETKKAFEKHQQKSIFFEITQIKTIFLHREIDIYLMQENFLTFLERSSKSSDPAQKILYFLKNTDINMKERNENEQVMLRKLSKQ